MKLTLTVDVSETQIMDRNDYGWTWDEERGKFRHERDHLFKTLEELLEELGPLMVSIDGVTWDHIVFVQDQVTA